jgi:hypothetical protein
MACHQLSRLAGAQKRHSGPAAVEGEGAAAGEAAAGAEIDDAIWSRDGRAAEQAA